MDVNKVINILNKLKDNLEKYKVNASFDDDFTYGRIEFKLGEVNNCFIYIKYPDCNRARIDYYRNSKNILTTETDSNNLPLKIVLMELKQMYDYYVENLFMESYSKIMNETDF